MNWPIKAQYYNGFEAPISRNTDDTTSHLAEKELNKGKRKSMIERIVECVKESPGKTSRELAKLYNLDPESSHKRASDAFNQKRIKKGGRVKCTISGRLACTWHI